MTQLDFFSVLEPTICKDGWTWEDAMASADTPDIAARRGVRETSFLFLLGKHHKAVA